MTDLTTSPADLRKLADAIENTAKAQAFALLVNPKGDKSLRLLWRSRPDDPRAAAFEPLLLQAIALNWDLLVADALGSATAPLLIVQSAVFSSVQADVAATLLRPEATQGTPSDLASPAEAGFAKAGAYLREGGVVTEQPAPIISVVQP